MVRCHRRCQPLRRDATRHSLPSAKKKTPGADRGSGGGFGGGPPPPHPPHGQNPPPSNPSTRPPPDTGDAVGGAYSPEQLTKMDRRFVARLERAFANGDESRESAERVSERLR